MDKNAEMNLAYMFDLWPMAIVRTSVMYHRCDNVTASKQCRYDIKSGEDYFDSGEMDIDHGHYRATIRFCYYCMVRPMRINLVEKPNVEYEYVH